MQVVTELKNRGIEQIYVACTDGLKGFPEAINSVFSKTVQLCIVHMVRNSTKYVSYEDLKEVTVDLKKIYSAVNESEGIREHQNFSNKWDNKYPAISDMWQRLWVWHRPFLQLSRWHQKGRLHHQYDRIGESLNPENHQKQRRISG